MTSPESGSVSGPIYAARLRSWDTVTMALHSRGTKLVSNLLSRHAGWALCSSRGMAGHDLHAAFTPLQQQVRAALHSCCRHCRRRRQGPPSGCSPGGGGHLRNHCRTLHVRLATLPAIALPVSTPTMSHRPPSSRLFASPHPHAAAPRASSAVSASPRLQFIDKEEKYGAHNYHPLPVVLNRGEGVFM